MKLPVSVPAVVIESSRTNTRSKKKKGANQALSVTPKASPVSKTKTAIKASPVTPKASPMSKAVSAATPSVEEESLSEELETTYGLDGTFDDAAGSLDGGFDDGDESGLEEEEEEDPGMDEDGDGDDDLDHTIETEEIVKHTTRSKGKKTKPKV